jgi:hypothetical protein
MSTAMDMPAAIEELLEAVFSMQSILPVGKVREGVTQGLYLQEFSCKKKKPGLEP